MSLRVEVKKGTDVELLAAKLCKQKEVINVKVFKPRKMKKLRTV